MLLELREMKDLTEIKELQGIEGIRLRLEQEQLDRSISTLDTNQVRV
jgi:hypothetical protein